MKKLLLTILIPIAAYASTEALALPKLYWSFNGIFDKFDRPSIQRGLQVFQEVCSTCHSVKRMAFRNLADIYFNENEIKAIASEFTIVDGPDDNGDMFERPGTPQDYWPSPYENEKQAASINNGQAPPDLSVIIKARKNGANYVYSLLTGYKDPPKDFIVSDGSYYNPYISGGLIAMAPPLTENMLEYKDNTPVTISNMAKDVVHFLQWVAEPEMEARKKLGLKTIIFCIMLTVFAYISKEKTWENIK